jgi:hypothetical protein
MNLFHIGSFLQSVHLYELLMGHKVLLLFYFEKGSEILHNLKVYRIFMFHPSLMCFFVVEWTVLRAFGNMSTGFLYLLRFQV